MIQQQEITLDAIKQGESLTLTFTYTDKDTGDAIDMSNYTMVLIVKNSPTQTTADITKLDAKWDKTDAASGIMAVTLTGIDTQNLDPETYHIEARAMYGSTVIKTRKDIRLLVIESMTVGLGQASTSPSSSPSVSPSVSPSASPSSSPSA